MVLELLPASRLYSNVYLETNKTQFKRNDSALNNLLDFLSEIVRRKHLNLFLCKLIEGGIEEDL